MTILSGFNQVTDAPGAQSLTDLTAFLVNRYSLQVGLKSPPSSLLRPGTIPAKDGLFPTMFTFSHVTNSFSNTVIPPSHSKNDLSKANATVLSWLWLGNLTTNRDRIQAALLK